MDDARVVRSIDHTEGKITVMAFRGDSQYLITGGEDCSCKLWELSSGKLTQVRKNIFKIKILIFLYIISNTELISLILIVFFILLIIFFIDSRIVNLLILVEANLI